MASDAPYTLRLFKRRAGLNNDLVRNKLLTLQCVFIELDNEDDAYLVFETLNTRGKNLRLQDLVKNHVMRLKRAEVRNVDLTKDRWRHFLKTFEASEVELRVDSYIHHFWLSRYDFVAQKKLFKRMKDVITRREVDQFLEALLTDAATYRVIHEPTFKRKWLLQERRVLGALEALALFGIRISVPFVLAIVRDWQSKQLSLRLARETLSALENFHFIFNAVCEWRATGGIAMMFAGAAKDLYNAPREQKAAVCESLRCKLKERTPEYEEFRVPFRRIVFTSELTTRKGLVRYILRRVAEHEGSPLDMAAMTIEHLAPQSSRLPDALVGRLGNLLLIPDKLNAEKLRNRPFVTKRELLAKAHIPLDDIIANAKQWGRAEIHDRTERLCELAYNTIWRT